jgi:tight adherence protein B
MRKLGAAALVLLAALVVGSPPGALAAGPSLSAAAGARFPERSFLLTLPQRVHLRPGQLSVSENGGPVRGLRAEPARASRRAKLGVVLAIDASSSMRGRPLAGALAAARAFARERNQRQPLALLAFNNRSHLTLPFTTLPYEISGALSRAPTAGGGTHVYDAARAGVELVHRARLPGGFVVVLSDGSDRGSSTTPATLVEAARAAHVRIYTVGLRSRAFDPSALRRLSSAAGGAYSEAASARELEGIYAALGSELSNGYLLRYRSLSPPHRKVRVAAHVSGLGVATSSYTSPRLDVATPGPVARGGGWSSPVAIAVVVLICTGLLAVALVALLGHARQTPRDRVAQFVGQDTATDGPPTLVERLVARVERPLARAAWWPAFEEELDVARVAWSAAQVVCAVGAATIALAAVLGSRQPIAGLAVLIAGPFAMRAVIGRRASRQRQLFGEQLADHLAVVVGAMRAGHGMSSALAAVLDGAPDPTRREFQRALTDEQLGAPLEDTLEDMGRRMRSRDLGQVAMLTLLQRETGADAAEMLDRVVATIRERQTLRRMVRGLTAQGRLSRTILTALPVVVLAALTTVNPTYVRPLYETGTGHVLLALAAVMVVTGSVVIQRIVKFEV